MIFRQVRTLSNILKSTFLEHSRIVYVVSRESSSVTNHLRWFCDLASYFPRVHHNLMRWGRSHRVGDLIERKQALWGNEAMVLS